MKVGRPKLNSPSQKEMEVRKLYYSGENIDYISEIYNLSKEYIEEINIIKSTLPYYIIVILRKKFDNTCQFCQSINIKTSTYKSIELHIHHLNGNKNDNRIDNLIALCPKCHRGIHNLNSILKHNKN